MFELTKTVLCRYFSPSWSTRMSKPKPRIRHSHWCATSAELLASSLALRSSASAKSSTSSSYFQSSGSNLAHPLPSSNLRTGVSTDQCMVWKTWKLILNLFLYHDSRLTRWSVIFSSCIFISRYLVRYLWSPYVIGQTIIFLPCSFYLLSIFFFLFLFLA